MSNQTYSMQPNTEMNQSALNAERLQRDLSPDEVARLAYRLWEKRNTRETSALEDWIEAERLLTRTKETSRQSCVELCRGAFPQRPAI